MKKAAVLGMGTISEIHLAAIAKNPEINLVGVCDIVEERRAKAPTGVPFFTDFREMIRQTAPDVVHICLPHYLHVPIAMEVAEMGVHVFMEKPLALDGAQGKMLVDFEAKHPELHIGICLQNRVNETVERLKELIDSGEYGATTGLTGMVAWHRDREYYREAPWRGLWSTAGGGCMINQAIHTLDLLYYLGGDICSLKASVSQLLDLGVEVEDTVTARMTYKNGAQGLFFATLANFKNEDVQIYVRLELAEFAITNNTLYRIGADGEREQLAVDARLPGSKAYYGASHSKLIDRFYRALEKNDQDYIHVRDGWTSLCLIDAIQASGRTGQVTAPQLKL